MFVSIFSPTIVWNICKKKWARYYHMYTHIGLHEKCLLLFSDFNESWIFLIDFRKMFKYQISWKFFQLEQSYSVRTDGRTDRHAEANSGFSQFCQSA
jgi:hypothetical protein